MICPLCGLLMGNTVQNAFECPQGHYKMWITSASSTALTLSAAQFPCGWGEIEPAKIPVPQELHDAFRDVEVIEP